MKHLATPVLLVSLATSGFTQDVIPFPMSSLYAGAVADEIRFEQDAGILAALVDLQAVHLEGLPLPGGASLDLDLERMSFDPVKDANAYVNGLPQAFDPIDLTLWKGTVAGSPGSSTVLALSSHGSYGWIRDRGQLYHVSALAGPGGDWSRAHGRVFTDEALNRAGDEEPPECAADRLNGAPQPPILPPPDEGDGQGPAGGQTVLEVRIAIETDYQLSQNWGNLQAEETYVFALIGAISDRFLEQVDVKITYPYVQFWTVSNDPWTSQDGGGADCFDLLNELQNAWGGNIPNDAYLGHFLSGASLGCGVAYLDVLCNQNNGFSVSCCINGGVNFPVTQGSNTWDFFVMAHELGHNFGSPHTHDYCPPLDECASGQCSNGNGCINNGTNMSYCHGCAGGMNNITTYFHNTVVGVMRTETENSCAPVYDPSNTTIFADDFEAADWTGSGWIRKRASFKSGAAHEGNWGVRIRKKGKLERTVDTTGFSDIVVRFWRKTKNYDAGEEFRFRYNSGNGWITLERVTPLTWGYVEFHLPASADNNPNLQIRFKSYQANEGKERSDIDQVEVVGQ